RVIIVPPGWEGTRVDYGLEAAGKHPDRFAVMGLIPIADPRVRDRIPEWKQQRGMLGIRVTFLGANAGRLVDGTADWLWAAAEKSRIPIMFLALRMAELARIAERHPELVLII